MISVYMVDLLSRLEVIKEAQSDDAGLLSCKAWLYSEVRLRTSG